MKTTSTDHLPQRRVVLLGASNIARSLSIVIDSARNVWGSPLDIVAATGHGRSYGMSSCVLGRTLPGILQSGLWDALAQRNPAPTATLLTDIGNDILYGASAKQITDWVERCLMKLCPISERIAITQLPITSLADLGSARFIMMRTILFPKSRLTLNDALATARTLNGNVVELATRFDVSIIEPKRSWYGFDPIHIMRRQQLDAWQHIFQSWSLDNNNVPTAQHSMIHWARLRCMRPQSRYLFGVHQQQEQPARRLHDGSVVSLY
jgi:hypothetical protein